MTLDRFQYTLADLEGPVDHESKLLRELEAGDAKADAERDEPREAAV